MSMKFTRTKTVEHWFGADYHFGHRNILRPEYDGRPFATIEEHDETIIARHNEVIDPKDHFWMVGDFALTTSSYMESILKRMNGEKHFLRGNHDRKPSVKLFGQYGIYHGEQVTISIDGQLIVLNHCRMYTWQGSHRGSWNIHGHSHGRLDNAPWGKTIDVAINIRSFYPVPFPLIQSVMHSKDILLTGDHHTNRE